MRFKELSIQDKDTIIRIYNKSDNKEKAQNDIAKRFECTTRTVRNWCRKLGVGLSKQNIINPSKILIYDIETSRVPAMVWWTGKQYVGHKQLREEPKIITIAYKWLGEDNIHDLKWDENQSDEKLLEDFLVVYNKADMVIGQNNDRFDNRWVNARAMKYRLDVNVFVKSFDIMKQTKRLFRLPSYSMDYITKFLGVENKLQHEGIIMWDKIQFGNKAEQKEYLNKMVDYNRQDIVATEDMYLSLRKYMGNKMHFGVANGLPSFSCPSSGSLDVQLYKTTITPAGTIQRIMKCNEDDVVYKISNKKYMDFIDYKIKNNIL